MTVINLQVEVPVASGTKQLIRGGLKIQPVREHYYPYKEVVGGVLYLPRDIIVTILDGNLLTTVNLLPSVQGEWAWLFEIRDQGTGRIYRSLRHVPDSETEIDFGDLPEVDPETLELLSDSD